jgi:hypothetical protein
VPEEILYDRMRTIWTGTDERGEIIWNAVFLDFARYWGFTPRLLPSLSGAAFRVAAGYPVWCAMECPIPAGGKGRADGV